MKKRLFILLALTLLGVPVLAGCSANEDTSANNETSNKTGTLEFYANGQDFAREGFVAKDGWALDFDHVYVVLSGITGYQSDPPYNPKEGGEIQAQEKVGLEKTYTVDIAEGSSPSLVGKVESAPAGHYNAISWEMVKANKDPVKGNVIVFIGQAEKDGKTVDFNIKLDKEIKYSAGEYVGDERKGFVQEGKTANLEITFHLDHLFGDAEVAADDALNKKALGFEPFASIAENGKLNANMAGLKNKLSSEEAHKLNHIIPHLGHVGEGHCHAKEL
ncbi:MAG: DUF4382 domain-containing protein [Clostridiales bacterium]|nr:DUF4382 domain-containing protein [Clostridiales bacterium]MCF8022913.1 DUF4382 domain-containing protein [Clostridiales bacterium]